MPWGANLTRRQVLEHSPLVPLAAGVSLAATGTETFAAVTPGKVLVAYFTRTGNTRLIATQIARARDATLFQVRAHASAEAERSRIHRIFGRYVPAQVAEQLIQAGQLSPQQREASIIFADIEGFTRLSETLPPSGVIAMLNSFFSAATAVIDDEGGVVVNYIGDALIAAFNAPLPVDGYPARAVSAARALLSLVSKREFEGHRLRLRIGVATGPVAAGTVGGAERQTYTLYGDTVNLAQRLEVLNKELGTECLICGTTFKEAGSVDMTSKGSVQIRGREGSLDVFALPAVRRT
jgi:class 3 adenylate cyclase